MEPSTHYQKHFCATEGSCRLGGLLLAVFALLFLFGDVFCLISEGLKDFDRPAILFFNLILPTLSLIGGVLLIRIGDVRYEWDDQTITRRGWFKRTTTLAWSEVTDLTIMSRKNQSVYLLYNGRGEAFRIDFSAIADDRGLQEWIQRRLDPIYRQTTGHTDFQIPFTSFCASVAGRSPGTLTLEPARIVQQINNQEVSIAYDEIKVVIIEMMSGHDSNRLTRYTLWDDSTERLSFDSCCFKAPQVVFFLRGRLKNAIWVDLAQARPPEDPHAATLYHQRRMANGRKAVKALLHSLVAYCVVVGIFGLYWFLQGKLEHKFGEFFSIFIAMLTPELIILKNDLWQGLSSRRAWRRINIEHGKAPAGDAGLIPRNLPSPVAEDRAQQKIQKK